jgi:hypothetical protein
MQAACDAAPGAHAGHSRGSEGGGGHAAGGGGEALLFPSLHTRKVLIRWSMSVLSLALSFALALSQALSLSLSQAASV